MRFPSSIYILSDESVNPTPEDVEDALRIEDDPEKMLLLIDLLFMGKEGKEIPS